MEGKCKKHASHKQAKGVCPYCLKERLEQLTASSASSTTNLSSSMASSAAYSSDNSSSLNESPRPKHGSNRTLLHLLKGAKEEPLRRSSSLAFPIGGEGMEERKEKKKKIKKRSKRSSSMFWTNFLLAGEGRRKEKELVGLYHSKTVKEKPSSRWAFFS